MSSARPTRPPLPLLVGFAVFLIAIGYLVAVSLVPRDVPTFAPTTEATLTSRGGTAPWTMADAEHAVALAAHVDTITIEATSAEEWRYISFERGAVLQPPDTIGWDMAVRRYHVRVAGDVADLGPSTAATISSAQPVFVHADEQDEAGHPVLRRWYRYGMLTHLLESKRHAYLIRTTSGRHAQVEVLSYYCPGPRAGCMTIRFAYPVQ